MPLAVEQTIPPRGVAVDLPRSEGYAADPFNMGAAPNSGSGREDAFAAATQPSRPSYDPIERHYYDDDMDDHEITTPTSDHQVIEDQPPVLPQKSALRASRTLDGLVGLRMSTPAGPPAFTQAPHDEYLSSEEEASSTTDDFSDFEYDSSSDDSSPSPAEDASKHEVTARVVSVIFSGKPSVVEVPQNRRSISPTSIERLQNAAKLQHAASNNEIELKNRRRMSSSTVSSRSSSRSISRVVQPPRSSSLQPAGSARPNLPFLKIDPYANGSTYSLEAPAKEATEREARGPQESRSAEDDRPKTPKTPNSMFKGVARAMSLMKRRSVPRLNQSYLAAEDDHAGRARSPSDASIPEETAEEPAPPRAPWTAPRRESLSKKAEPLNELAAATFSSPALPPPRPQLRPVTHDEIVRLAERNARMNKHISVNRALHGEQLLESPVSPMSPLTTPSPMTPNKRSSTFSFSRRRMSVKLTGKLQL